MQPTEVDDAAVAAAAAAAVPATYRRRYEGRRSEQTIKGVSFFGPDSEYVVSGSDDARIVIWSKRSGRVLRELRGHHSVVNVIAPHPFDPLFASSGIDNVVKIWEPSRAPFYENRNEGDAGDDEDAAQQRTLQCGQQ
jgi:WD40 repeat protein